MAKYAAAEAAIECVDRAIQTHGGNGFALEYGLSDMWWGVRLTRTAPVSREMILNYVAEHSLGLAEELLTPSSSTATIRSGTSRDRLRSSPPDDQQPVDRPSPWSTSDDGLHVEVRAQLAALDAAPHDLAQHRRGSARSARADDLRVQLGVVRSPRASTRGTTRGSGEASSRARAGRATNAPKSPEQAAGVRRRAAGAAAARAPRSTSSFLAAQRR